MPKMPLRTDEELLACVAHGEPAAFGEFYDRHYLTLLAAVRARTRSTETAFDVTAEVFAAALQGVHSYVARGEGSARAWLYGIARYKLIDVYRHGHAEGVALAALGMQRIVFTDEALGTLERRLDAENTDVLKALKDLPEHERDAITARVLDEDDYTDIAREQRVTESVVRQRVSRGLRRLRSSMEDKR